MYRYIEGNVQFEKNWGGHETPLLLMQDFCKGQTAGADHSQLWARGKPGYIFGYKSASQRGARWTSVLMPDTREGGRFSELNLINFLPHSPTYTHLRSAKGTQQQTQQTHNSLFVHHVDDIKDGIGLPGIFWPCLMLPFHQPALKSPSLENAGGLFGSIAVASLTSKFCFLKSLVSPHSQVFTFCLRKSQPTIIWSPDKIPECC